MILGRRRGGQFNHIKSGSLTIGWFPNIDASWFSIFLTDYHSKQQAYKILPLECIDALQLRFVRK